MSPIALFFPNKPGLKPLGLILNNTLLAKLLYKITIHTIYFQLKMNTDCNKTPPVFIPIRTNYDYKSDYQLM